MELGLIGLGRMGNSMAQRLLAGGHTLVVYDPSPEAGRAAVEGGAVRVGTIPDLAAKLTRPCAVWLMVPSGAPTESTVNEVSASLSAGDTVVDGGNSYYKDSIRRAAALREREIHFLDVGTSGGVWGLKEGYCMMVGGDEAAFGRIEPILQSLAPSPDKGYGHVGPSGAGHFVKMIHNGIEYGLMQAYAEGMELMRAREEFHLDLHQVAEIWRHGSVVRSWLLDLAARALKDDPALEHVAAYVEDSGEGRWTVLESVELAVPTPVITESLHERFRSRRDEPFSARLLAALRQQFGGHRVRKTPGA